MEISITSMEITIATTITGRWSAIPTAVITESSENTMSRSRIWAITMANVARAIDTPAACCSPSTLS